MNRGSITILVAAAFTLIGCASSGGAPSSSGGGTRALACKSGDQVVKSASACLQDDAACYQLSNGTWCTGERGNTCPAGSNPIPAGAPCPRGSRCFAVGESLTCVVTY